MKRLLKSILIFIGSLLIGYFLLIASASLWVRSEGTLEFYGWLASLPERLTFVNSRRQNLAAEMLTHTQDLAELKKLTLAFGVYDVRSQPSKFILENLVYSEFNKEHNRAFGYSVDTQACKTSIVRGCVYEGKWYFQEIYITIHTGCNYKDDGKVAEAFAFMLREIDYFSDPLSVRPNKMFWHNNWRLFKDLQYAESNDYQQKIREQHRRRFGNTCDFVAELLSDIRK